MKKKLIIITSSVILLLLTVFLIILFAVIIPKKNEEKEWEELVRKYYSEKLETYKKENELYDDYEVDIVFLGDSLTDGYDVKAYYSEYLVSNRGIGGATTIGLENRLEVSAYELKPKVLVMLIGANNMSEMFTNYEDILKGFKENLPNTKIVILSLTAMGGEHWGKKNELAAYNNVKIKKYAIKYGYYYVDLFTPLFDEDKGEVYDGYTIDGGHFTKEGYDVVTSIVKPVVEEALNDYYNG
jgi:lysophospholipase L1-like esterase